MIKVDFKQWVTKETFNKCYANELPNLEEKSQISI